MAAATTKVGKVKAKQAAVVTAGARPPMFEKRIVRDRHSGKLMEIDMNREVPLSTRATWVAATSSPKARK
jgi:hypothetical protein